MFGVYDEKEGDCIDVHPEEWMEKAYSVIWSLFTAILPVSFMITLYSRVAYTLWFKRAVHDGREISVQQVWTKILLHLEPVPFLLEGPLQRENRDLTIRQRWPRWKRRWEIGFAFFRFFSLLFQWTQLLKRREFWLELKRRDRAWVLTEMVEFIALQFPFPSKLKIGSCHVLVMQGRKEMYEKACCTCRVVILLVKPIASLAFLLASPS